MARELPEGTVTRVYHLMLVTQVVGGRDLTPEVRDALQPAEDAIGDILMDAPYGDGYLWSVTLKMVEPAGLA